MSVSSEFFTEFFTTHGGGHDLRSDEASARILLVEDNLDYARLVQEALGRSERGHFSVVHAERLSIGLQLLGHESYDAMLLDLSLPDSDRLATIETAATLAHRLPVILMTGTGDRALGEHARELGAADVVLKHCLDRAELPSTLLRAVRRHRRFGSGGVDPVICRIPSA